jgi:uncharacterized protein (DUF305 family)
MIVHHLQALEMVELVATRSQNGDIRLLAQRIELSQVDEIGLMERWLEARGESVTLPENHEMHEPHMMPGMLTPEQMASLEAARGSEFDRLFLESMIQHHEGALVMVAELFASPRAGQETEISQFASHVEADQGIEIRRMSQMLGQSL